MRKLIVQLKDVIAAMYLAATKQSWKVLVPAGVMVMALVGASGWLVNEQIATRNEMARAKATQMQQPQAANSAKQEAVLTQDISAPTPQVTARNTHPPHDPRFAGPLQPNSDKPPIPKTQKSLRLRVKGLTPRK